MLLGSHPAHECLTHIVLSPHIEVIPLQDSLQRFSRQLWEVLLLDNLGELRGDVVLS